MKTCFKCGEEKSEDSFYKHPAMEDGHLNKCKECTKKDVRDNYRKNIVHYKEYEKYRSTSLARREKAKEAARKLRKEHPERVKEYHKKFDIEKRKAENRVNNAIRDGRLQKMPCIICGNIKSEAHHEDYSKPLQVVWLCRECHCLRHKEINRQLTA